jgi:hypothetical protein
MQVATFQVYRVQTVQRDWLQLLIWPRFYVWDNEEKRLMELVWLRGWKCK